MASWLTDIDRAVFGRYQVEVTSDLPEPEALVSLQDCVKPYKWLPPVLFRPEALYGTVTRQKISFSRLGVSNVYGGSYEFVGSLIPTSQGSKLVGELHAKWYWRVIYLAYLTGFLSVLISLVTQPGTMPLDLALFFTVIVVGVLIFFLFFLRRSGADAASYIVLVVSNALAQRESNRSSR